MTIHARLCALMVRAITPIFCLALTPAISLAEIPAPNAPAGFVLVKKGHGWTITDTEQMTLYTSKRDIKPGKSTCVEDCAVTWPPYSATERARTGNEWSVITREDGSKQWAYKDKPLYRFSVDQGPGDTYGEGIGLLWDISFIEIPKPPGIRINKTLIGHVAADQHQRTLYTPQVELDAKSLCIKNACLEQWSPVIAPGIARSIGDWSVVTRDDGLKQWAYQGRPLFRYSDDVLIGEFAGHDVAFDDHGNVMEAMVIEPRPPYPDWVRVQDTDAGEMLADENYMTIYTWDPSRLFARLRDSVPECGAECLDEEWVPKLADESDVAPGGNWAILTLSSGRRQWAYKGRHLFVNTRDKTQGSFLGYRHGGNRAVNVVMHSGDALQGTLRQP
jgi:predicted lipoprotein with Yx(FWY)xxD motif